MKFVWQCMGKGTKTDWPKTEISSWHMQSIWLTAWNQIWKNYFWRIPCNFHHTAWNKPCDAHWLEVKILLSQHLSQETNVLMLGPLSMKCHLSCAWCYSKGLCTIVQQNRHMESISFQRVNKLDLSLQTKFPVHPCSCSYTIYCWLQNLMKPLSCLNVLHIQN